MTNQFTSEIERAIEKTVIAKKFNNETLEFENFPKEKGGVYLAVKMNPTGSAHLILGVGTTKDFNNIQPRSELVEWFKIEGATHVVLIICDHLTDANVIELNFLNKHQHAKQLSTGALYRL